MRCIVIGTSRTLRSDLEYALAAIPGTTLMRTLDHYPHQYELTRLFEAYGPDLVFVEMNDLVEERDTIIAVEKLCPHVVIVGIRDSATQDLMGAMRLGVREFLTAPITANTVTPVVNRVFELMGARASVNQSTSLLFTFLPSKPGVGTTTIAVNTALALADRLDGQTVLVDFDQSSGMIGFLLNLQHDYSLSHAVERVAEMDDALWKHIVAKYEKLDVLPTHASRPMNSPSVSELRHPMPGRGSALPSQHPSLSE